MFTFITIIITIYFIFNALTAKPTHLSSPLKDSIDKLDAIIANELAKDEATMAHIQSNEYQDALNEEYATKMRKELQEQEAFRANYYKMVAQRLAEVD